MAEETIIETTKEIAVEVSEKVTAKVPAAKKVAKKVTKKATAIKKAPAAKKVAKKVVKKAPAAKKVTKKVTKKVVKKVSVAKKAATGKAKKTSKAEAKKVANRIEQLQVMLQDNLSGLSGDKAEAMAKNIWLAGLGAYSRSYEELSERYEDVQDKYEEINAEGQKVFGELVKRGESIQGDLEQAVNKGRDSLEDRVEDFKKRFGGGLSSFVDIPSRLRDAAEKIEEISVKLQKKK